MASKAIAAISASLSTKRRHASSAQ